MHAFRCILLCFPAGGAARPICDVVTQFRGYRVELGWVVVSSLRSKSCNVARIYYQSELYLRTLGISLYHLERIMEVEVLLLGVLGNAMTIFSFASSMPTFWHIYKRKSTQSFDSLPYTCTLLNCMIWVYYTIIKKHETMVLLINSIGCAFQVFYLVLFVTYAPKSRKVSTIVSLMFISILFIGFMLVMNMTLHGHERSLVVGIISCTCAILMYGSPLGIIGTVIRTRSVEFMPLLLSLGLFLRSIAWFGYSFVIKDLFIEVPTTIGAFLGAFQLAIYMYYKYFVVKKDLNSVMEISTAHEESLHVKRGENSSIILDSSSNLIEAPANDHSILSFGQENGQHNIMVKHS